MTTAQLIKHHREAAGLKPSQAATLAGLSLSFWYELENDQASPRVTTLQSIAKALNCLPAALIPVDSTKP